MNQRIIAVCLPGENFSRAWVESWTRLHRQLLESYSVIEPFFEYSSNVYLTRACIAANLALIHPKPAYILWLDDDNLLTFEQFQRLARTLDANPEIGIVAGWSWIDSDVNELSQPTLSCGHWDPDIGCVPFTPEELHKGSSDLKEIGWTGFPAVLMRREALMEAGPRPFAPYPFENHPLGFLGEDASFCRRAKEAGVRLFVDRQVEVPHLKLKQSHARKRPIEFPRPHGLELQSSTEIENVVFGKSVQIG